jgi:hydroxypyruvate isomerase
MPRFAANLSMLFTEVAFLDRFDRAAKAGFKAVEFLFPYDHPAAEIKARLDANGLELVLHNLPAGNWDGGERGIGCLPDRTSEFRSGVARAVEYATLGSTAWRARCRRTSTRPCCAGPSSRTCASPPRR